MAEFQPQQYKRGAKACAKRKGHGFSTKCASLVKQEHARLYILRRCATCSFAGTFKATTSSIMLILFGSTGLTMWNINP
ncbi:hypothetical protein Goari_004894 [Gossypium aridum]|uniref:Uncharacterized protein n=1 Tax=Gossypium aridum TaxID=34290 RepID=A0A7J8Y6E0_GOSAI|nr:hypothetical protein [Gossypium aridum]